MKHLKKINELFDTDEIKSQHEIQLLQGMDIKDIMKLNYSKNSKFINLHRKLVYYFPIFRNCPDNNRFFKCTEQPEGYYNYMFLNETKYLQISFFIENDKTYFVYFIIKDIKTNKEEYSTQYFNLTSEKMIKIVGIVSTKILNFLNINIEEKSEDIIRSN